MSPRTLGGADGPDADADFWRWASSRGVVAVRCESRDVAEGWRGIVATEDIERDAVVLRVPGALLMSARSMNCLLYTSPSPRDMRRSRMPSSA